MRHVVSGLGTIRLVFDQGPFVAKASVVEVCGGPCVAVDCRKLFSAPSRYNNNVK